MGQNSRTEISSPDMQTKTVNISTSAPFDLENLAPKKCTNA